MKVYITDFWFILIIKVLRRMTHPKLRDDTAALDRLEHAAMAMHIYSSVLLGLSFMTAALLFNDNPINRYIAPAFIALSFIWLIFRHLRNERWIIIEKNINDKFSKRKRDIIFFTMFFTFYVVNNLTLIGLFICK